jgi:enoyl-CoA hydratase/carnithine racemase
MSRAADLALETLRLEQDGRVVTARCVTLPLNFATSALLRDLDQLTRAVDRDRSVGAVVLTGGVEGRFLTHADPLELGDMIDLPHPQLPAALLEPGLRLQNVMLRLPGLARMIEHRGGAVGKGLVWGYRWKRTVLRMNRSSTVYLAAINGPTLGGGHELALACDLRYAADTDDVLVGQIETLAGLIPGGGGTQRLPRMLGTSRAIEHILEGTPITARQAHELGLVHKLAEPDELLAETQATAARLAQRSPVAIAALKRSIYFATSRPLARGLDYELAGFLAAGTTRAMKRTVAAFREDLDRHGDTPFLVDPRPWIDGSRLDQVT